MATCRYKSHILLTQRKILNHQSIKESHLSQGMYVLKIVKEDPTQGREAFNGETPSWSGKRFIIYLL